MTESSTVVQVKTKKSKIKVVGELSNKLTDQVSKRVRNAVRDSITSAASQLPLVMSGLSTASTGITATASLFSATLSTIALTATVVSASTVALIEVIDTQGINTIDATLGELGINLPEEFKDLVQELALNMTAEEIQTAKETLTTDLDVIKNLVIDSAIKDDEYSVEKIMQIAYQTTDNSLIKSVAMSLENMSLSLSDFTDLINQSDYLVELSGEKYQTYQNANQSQGQVEVYSVSFEGFFENSNQQFKIAWFDPKYGLQEQTYPIDSQDYESTGNYPITIDYAASDGNTYTRDYNLIVKDVNEAPVFISADVLEVNENQNFVVIVSYVDEEQGLVQRTYEIPAGNHEKSDVYLLKSSVVDSGGLVSEYDVAIKILNVNEPAQLVSVSTTTMNENEIVVISALWNDPEDGLVAINYTLPFQDYENNSTYSQILNYIDSNGLSVNAFTNYDVLNINEAAVLQSFNVTSTVENSSIVGVAVWLDPEDGLISISIDIPIKDYETDQSFIQELSYVDSGSILVQESKLINVLNVNETAVLKSISHVAVIENQQTLLKIVLQDQEDGEIISYFTIPTQDYEQAKLYSNYLDITDSGGVIVRVDFSLTIENTNETAVYQYSDITNMAENSGQTIITSYWLDPEDGLISSQSVLPAQLNYENSSSYALGISIVDSNGLEVSTNQTIQVNDVNETPYDLKTTSTFINGEYVIRLSALDPDNNTLSFYRDGILLQNNSISYTTQQLANNPADIVLTVRDSDGLEVSITVSPPKLTLVPGVDSPAQFIESNVISILENTTGVATLKWFDPEKGIIETQINIPLLNYETTPEYKTTVSVTDDGGNTTNYLWRLQVVNVNEAPTFVGFDSSLFVVENNTYEVRTVWNDPEQGLVTKVDTFPAQNYETTKTLEHNITFTDAGGLTQTVRVNIQITDVNEAPVFVRSNTVNVLENAGYYIETVWRDPEQGLVTQTDYFATPLNYETTRSTTHTISFTDSGGITTSQNVSVNVLNVNELAVFVRSNTTNVLENGSFTVETVWNDPEQGLVTKYDFFNEKYDYETTPNISKTITFTDAGGLVSTANISLNIVDVNEKPSAMFWDAGKFSGKASGNIVTINNFNENGNVIGVLEAVDPEGRNVIWSIVNSDGSNVSISNIDPSSPYYNSSTLGTSSNYQNGKLLVINNLNYEKDPYREITLRATDEAGNFQDTKVIIYLKDVLEGPQNGDFSQGLSGWIVSGGGSGISGYSYNVSVVNGKAQLEMSGTVGAFGTGYGPSLTSTRFNIDSGELLSFKWTAANTGDDAVMQVYLIDANNGSQTLILNHQGNGSGEYRQIVTQDGEYSLRIVGGSYDASGGTYIGSLITLDDVQIG